MDDFFEKRKTELISDVLQLIDIEPNWELYWDPNVAEDEEGMDDALRDKLMALREKADIKLREILKIMESQSESLNPNPSCGSDNGAPNHAGRWNSNWWRSRPGGKMLCQTGLIIESHMVDLGFAVDLIFAFEKWEFDQAFQHDGSFDPNSLPWDLAHMDSVAGIFVG